MVFACWGHIAATGHLQIGEEIFIELIHVAHVEDLLLREAETLVLDT